MYSILDFVKVILVNKIKLGVLLNKPSFICIKFILEIFIDI